MDSHRERVGCDRGAGGVITMETADIGAVSVLKALLDTIEKYNLDKEGIIEVARAMLNDLEAG